MKTLFLTTLILAGLVVLLAKDKKVKFEVEFEIEPKGSEED